MPIYISKNTKGDIIALSKYPGDGYEKIDCDGELVRGWDEYFYKPDERPTPPGPALEDGLAAIEAKYAGKQAELDSALVNALWVGGPQEASIRGSLMAKRQKLIDDRDAEIAALFA